MSTTNSATKTFDLVVIGTGVAASTAAYQCISENWKVAIIDSRPFGGTCALRGCDPKKVLVGGAELIDWDNRMEGKGVVVNSKMIHIDWQDLMHFKRSFTEPVPKNREEGFSKAGIATFHGRAHFVGPTTLKVKGGGGGVGEHDGYDENNINLLEGRHVLVATGAKPAKLDILGEEYVITSDQFLELEKLPEQIVFIGGGYISFEFAHIAARAGVKKVTILHRGKRPLNHFDPDLVDRLVQATHDLGIDVQLQVEVKKVEKKSSGVFIVNASRKEESLVNNNNDRNIAIETNMVVHGGGRVPEIDDLNLEEAGVDYDPRRGIKVNEYLQSTSNPAVYAAGDAAGSGGPQLTPIAIYEGQIVADNLIKGNHIKPNFNGVPSVVFTVPPLASVGLQEQAAKEQGINFKTNYVQDTSSWYSSRRIGEKYSGFKVLVEKEGAGMSGRILGAHLLGHNSEEVINLFAIAIRQGISSTDLKEAVFSYPTNSSDITYML
jgi:glutathione reductase (NADPH)